VSGFINLSICAESGENEPPKRELSESKPLFRVNPRPERTTAEAEAVVNPGGIAVKRQDKLSVPNPEGVGDRGKVTGRSQKSRRRLMEHLSKVDLDKLAGEQGKRSRFVRLAFVTLTYPKHFPGWERAKRDLRTFKERVVYHYPLAWAVWVEEFQQRGAVHFHLIMCFDSQIDLYCFRSWLSRSWYEVVDSGDPQHLKAGTQAVPVFTKRGVGSLMGYLAGEMGKIKQVRPTDEHGELIETGRTWGFWYKDRMPFETLAVVVFETREAWETFKGSVAMYYHGKCAYLAHVHEYAWWGGALLYGSGRHLFMKLIDGIPGVSLRDPVEVLV
jgi:hypothetical protein